MAITAWIGVSVAGIIVACYVLHNICQKQNGPVLKIPDPYNIDNDCDGDGGIS